jgi:ribosomal protein S18 acetylase RimI-like enzyme
MSARTNGPGNDERGAARAELRTLHGDAGPSLDLLVRAFDDDPFFRFLMPDRDRRAALVREVMRSNLDVAIPNGFTRVTDGGANEGDLRGLCVWMPPHAYPPSALSVLSARGAAVARTVARMIATRRTDFPVISHALRIADLMDEAHPPQPYYYLQVLAVDPRWHGRGIGSSILREILAEADRDGALAVLETAKELNVQLYRRHGFEIARTTVLRSGPPMWTMFRTPGREYARA